MGFGIVSLQLFLEVLYFPHLEQNNWFDILTIIGDISQARTEFFLSFQNLIQVTDGFLMIHSEVSNFTLVIG